jgi:hypothetical protein
MKRMLVVMMTIGIMFSGINAAWAIPLTINPSADTWIPYYTEHPEMMDTNYGSSTSLYLSNWPTRVADYRTLLMFNLSGLPAGSQVTSITLTLYPWMLLDFSAMIQVHRMADDTWNEGTITWNLAPTSFTTAFVPNLLDTQPVNVLDPNPVIWNLNSWDWSPDRTDGLVTFLLKITSDDRNAFFNSKEDSRPGYRPVLTINYDPVPIPPSALLLGSVLLGLAGWRRLRKG